MKTGLLVADFSGVYEAEGFLPYLRELGLPLHHAELGDIEGTVCYCDADAEAEIRRRLAPAAGARIRWIDSGDYHYVTKILAEFQTEPFVLVLVDNHPDDQEPAFGGVLSCGSWVREMREKQPLMTEAWTLGPDHQGDIDQVLAAVEGKRVYLSIDKDVLRREESRTDWSQGTYSLETLADWIRRLMEQQVVAIDLCGELVPAKGATPEDLRINGETNRYLQELLLDCLK